jgi:phospholipid-binding lipoprotein MlaA
MSSGTFLIAFSLASAQAGPVTIPLFSVDPAAIEAQSPSVPAASEEKTGDPSAADPQTAKPASPEAASEPPGPDDTIVVTAKPGSPAVDPLQGLNVKSYAVVQSVDKAVTGPMARTYKKSVPSPVRSGLRNVLANLEEPVVFLNYLLQLKPGKSAETLGRFAINSTIGAAGLFDVAKRRPFGLPHRTNGFGYTLGYYGVKPGPYMYLPLMGPTTVRDFGGRLLDLSLLPVAIGKPFSELAYVIPVTTIRLIDERAEADEGIQERTSGSSDPYSAVRADYLRRRQAEIDALHGQSRDERQPSSKSETPDEGAVFPPPAG